MITIWLYLTGAGFTFCIAPNILPVTYYGVWNIRRWITAALWPILATFVTIYQISTGFQE